VCEVRIEAGQVMCWRCLECGEAFGIGRAPEAAETAAKHEKECGPVRLDSINDHVYVLIPPPPNCSPARVPLSVPADRYA
jgi:hypothetical protein